MTNTRCYDNIFYLVSFPSLRSLESISLKRDSYIYFAQKNAHIKNKCMYMYAYISIFYAHIHMCMPIQLIDVNL